MLFVFDFAVFLSFSFYYTIITICFIKTLINHSFISAI